MSKFDVLGLGAAAIDQLIYVECYPAANTKTTVLRSAQQCGGLTATALVAAARLGARCAYAGQLSNDANSQFVRNALEAEGVSFEHCVALDDARPIHSVIIVGTDSGSRTIFPEQPERSGAHPTLPDASALRSARVLLVDHIGVPGMLRAAQIARAAGNAVVSDVERDVSEHTQALLALVNHPILGEEFALRSTATGTAEAAVRALWSPARNAVTVTCGERGAYFSDDGVNIQHQPAFTVNVVDTTGCGDVFHGAYCAMLARNCDTATCVRYAAGAAALKATQPGGQAGAPTLDRLRAFLGL